MVAQQVRAYHTRIRHFLLEHAEATARTTEFVQRRSPLTGSLFVMTLIFTVFQDKTRSLARYVDTVEALDPAHSLSVQAFDQRFTTQAVAMMRALFGDALRLRAPLAETTQTVLACFAAVYILDSTNVPMPQSLAEMFRGWGGTASKAGAKAAVLVEWFSGCIEQIQVHSGRTPDQGLGSGFLAQTRPGALWLFDLGFWKCAFLAQIAAAGSWFVCRLQGGVTVRECVDGVEGVVDVDRWLRTQVGTEAVERPIVLGQKKEKVACRLIAVKVPAEVAAERRRKLRRKAQNQGRTPRKSTLFRQGFTLYVTNTSPEMIATAAVREVGRVRWQVELLFKVAKSGGGLATFTSQKAERVACEFYAVLIALVLVTHLRRLLDDQIDQVSLMKLWRRLGTRVLEWGRALRRRGGAQTLVAMLTKVARHVRPSKRDKYPSTYQRMQRLVSPHPPRALPPPLGRRAALRAPAKP